MIIADISKSLAELYKSLLAELRPDWKVEIIIGDYNLWKLGFVKEIPCSLDLDVSEEEISELHDEIIYMEIDAYNDGGLLTKNPLDMSEQEKKEYRELKKFEKKYRKYELLEGLCYYLLQQES